MPNTLSLKSTLTFTNLHVSPQGWFLTSRSPDGKMANFDLSHIEEDKRNLIATALMSAVRDPYAERTDQEAGGIQ